MRPKFATAPTTNTPIMAAQKPVSRSATKSCVNMMSRILPMQYGTDMVMLDETTRQATLAPIVQRSGPARRNSRRKSDSVRR